MTPEKSASLGFDSKTLRDLLIVFAIYFGSGWLGIRYAGIGDGSLSLIWLPSGVGLASCIIFGARIWPAIWLASFASNSPYLFDAAAQYPYLKMIFYGAGAATVNTLVQSLFAFKLYKRFVEPVGFDKALGIFEFIIRVAAFASMLNILVLACFYYTGGYWLSSEGFFSKRFYVYLAVCSSG